MQEAQLAQIHRQYPTLQPVLELIDEVRKQDKENKQLREKLIYAYNLLGWVEEIKELGDTK